MPSAEVYTARDGSRTWRVRLRVRGRHTSETFGTKAEAQRFCQLVDALGPEAAVQHRDTIEAEAGIPTLDELAARHIEALSGITEGTRTSYRRLYQRTWAPLIGHRRVDLVTREHVAGAVNTLARRYADKSVANAHGLLAAILAAAVRDGLIRRSPSERIRLPRSTGHQRVEARFLTREEFAKVLEHLPAKYRPVILTLAGTGMRWGELEALAVADVDLRSSMVRIVKAVKYGVGPERQVGPPKTARSRRTVTLPPQVVEALRPVVAGRPGTAPLFAAVDGQPVRHHAVYRAWRKACSVAGLEPLPRLHDVRHSHVAWLVAAGVGIPVIQARLGHESVTTTIDTYGHLLPDLQLAAAHAASVALGPKAPPATAALPSGRR